MNLPTTTTTASLFLTSSSTESHFRDKLTNVPLNTTTIMRNALLIKLSKKISYNAEKISAVLWIDNIDCTQFALHSK